jgi:hypothetical protein
MEVKKQKTLKLTANTLLFVLLLSIAGQLSAFYQTKYQLTSPVIPEHVILQIVSPFIFSAFVSTLICIAGLILYFYQRYLLVIIVCGLAIIWQQVYLHF